MGIEIAQLQQIKNKVVDWKDKTGSLSRTGTALGTTVINVTGSGYLVTVHNSDSGNQAISVEVDAGDIWTLNLASRTAIPLFAIRFNSSVLIKTGNLTGAISAGILLD